MRIHTTDKKAAALNLISPLFEPHLHIAQPQNGLAFTLASDYSTETCMAELNE